MGIRDFRFLQLAPRRLPGVCLFAPIASATREKFAFLNATSKPARCGPRALLPRWHQQTVCCEDVGGLLIQLEVGILGGKDDGSVVISRGLYIFHQYAML